MSRVQQHTTGLARICAFSLFALLCACSDSVNLQTGLNDADANEIISVLNRHGIEARKETMKESVTLQVPRKDISRATDIMRTAGLPRQNLSNLGKIFKKEGMISTPLEERVRYIHGLSQELEYTLQQFDRVITARVHVVLPERIAPGEPIQPSSAAVFIKYRPPFDEDTVIPRVRNLVASSIPGLTGEEGRSKVSVVLTPSEVVDPSASWTVVGPFSVQVNSAGLLTWTLLALMLFAAVGLTFILAMMGLRHPKTARWTHTQINVLRALAGMRGNQRNGEA